jgi:type IV secretion system protein TrbJ
MIMVRFLSRRMATTAALCLSVCATAIAPVPALAQFTVYDPANYAQSLLIAARSLQQINNQIQSLQNQATMLVNQAKNLTRIDFPQLQQLTQTLQQIDQLMQRAQTISFKVESVDTQYGQLYPQSSSNAALTSNARAQLNASIAAYQQTMTVQAQVASNVAADGANLTAIVGQSQSAQGALQAAQATNQLLALVAKQQLQIQNLMAAQGRSSTLDAARAAQAELDARAATSRFLGTGTAYTPQ